MVDYSKVNSAPSDEISMARKYLVRDKRNRPRIRTRVLWCETGFSLKAWGTKGYK